MVLRVDAGVKDTHDLEVRLAPGGRCRDDAVAEADAHLVGELISNKEAVRVGREGLETALDHIMQDVGDARFARRIDANPGDLVVAPGTAKNDLADQRRRRGDPVHRVERVQNRRGAGDAPDWITRQNAVDFNRSLRMERHQRLRRRLADFVIDDDVRICFDELRQEITVEAIHHPADTDEDRDPEHHAADRDRSLAFSRQQMRECDGKRQRGHGAMRTASPSLRRSGASRTMASWSRSPFTISIFAGPTAPVLTSTRLARPCSTTKT